MAEKTEETVTIKKSELESMLADREKAAKRTPEETAIRSAIREEVAATLDEKLAAFFDLGDGDGGNNDGGAGGGENFWTSLGKAFGGK